MQQKKRLAGKMFSQVSVAGSGAHKPRWEFKGGALEPFFHVILRLNWALIVQLNYVYQCKTYDIFSIEIVPSVVLKACAKFSQKIPGTKFKILTFFLVAVLGYHTNCGQKLSSILAAPSIAASYSQL